jgi:hypothetical protein
VFSWLLLLICLTTGCSKCHLSVCSEYLDERYLASYHCFTPDPLCDCFFGEQLIVNWLVPSRYLDEYGATIHLSVRFRNRKLERIVIPILRSQDTYTYRIIGNDYLCSGGILTFKAEIIDREGRLLDQWCHHVWVEYIGFDCE